MRFRQIGGEAKEKMFENMTYEKIMSDMLAQVNNPVDKREGSLLWDALAPAAWELARLYAAMDQVLLDGFADTASRQYLVLRASERGLAPREASAARALGEIELAAGAKAPLGARFCCDRFNWRIVADLGDRLYELECEELGSRPNAYIGNMVPLEYMNGLNKAELIRILAPGEDVESTESFRARYLKDLVEQSFGGNAADYVNKAESIAGVGAAKVQAAWNGGGTVKLILLNEKMGVPDNTLVQRVQMTFDPPPGQGVGLGLAPIGHVVTAAAARSRSVAVSLDVTLREGWQLVDVQKAAAGCVDEYFADLCAEWGAAERLIVRLSQLEARILQLNGVLDVSNLRLNGQSANLTLAADEIPVRGQVSVH